MKTYKADSNLAQKVRKVHDLMMELGLTVEYLGGSLRFSDENNSNVILIDADTMEEMQFFPTGMEYKLKAFNS